MFRQRVTSLAATSLALGAALMGSQIAGSPAGAATHASVHLARASTARLDTSVNGLLYAQRAYRSPARRTTFPINVCVLPANNQCINDWNGNLTEGAQAARFFHYGNSGGNNRIQAQYVNTIDTSGSFQPFSNGSGLNTRYNGRPVYMLQWAKNGASGVCIAGTVSQANPFNLNCNNPAQNEMWFVYSSYSDLIAVYSSNFLFQVSKKPNQPVWLGSNGVGNTGNGANVYLTRNQSWNLAWGFKTDGG